MKRQNPSKIDEQLPGKVWGGRKSEARYVSICLVSEGETNLTSRETVAELQVNSSQLTKCSKYFEVCLSKRWANPNSSAPSTKFNLEMIHGLEVGVYADCFSRMGNTLCKDFKDVKSCLELLRVASQIEFDELISSIFKHLSTILWSYEDELKIRQYSLSPDFRKSHAQGLLARLELDESPATSQEQISDLIRLRIRTALLRNGCPKNDVEKNNIDSARSCLQALLSNIGQNGSPAFDTNMVKIVSNEVQKVLKDFQGECTTGEASDKESNLNVNEVSGIVPMLEAVSWILKALVTAKVADEVVECLLLLDKYPKILAVSVNYRHFSFRTYMSAVLKFMKLIVDIHREVVVGNVVVGIPARVALLERWRLLEFFPWPIWRDIICQWDYARAVEDVFSTLPFRLQMSLVEHQTDQRFISPIMLASLLKRQWTSNEENQELLEAEESKNKL